MSREYIAQLCVIIHDKIKISSYYLYVVTVKVLGKL